MTPVLSDEQMKEAVKKYETFLTDNGAEIVHQENWGLRKLAYPIQKKSTGFYQLIEYKSPGELVSKVEIQLKRDERILRFLSVKLDKFAIAYNNKKRDMKKSAKENKEKE